VAAPFWNKLRSALRRHYRLFTSVLYALCAAAFAVAMKGPITLDGPLLDGLIAVRAAVFRPAPSERLPVVVVALDQRSLAAAELKRYPRAMMAPIWAAALSAVMEAGARAVGFDELFLYDADTFAGITPDFDRPFLVALYKYREHVALARSAAALPAKPFAFSVGYDAIGLAEIAPDPDGRYRHVRAEIQTSGGRLPTLSALVLERSGLKMPPEVLLAPRRHLERIPTYAMIDLLRSAQNAPDALRAAFSGKIVLFGGTLPEEDRKPSSGRFLRPAAEDSAPGPGGLRLLRASDPGSDMVPGVFLHAAAIEAVAAGDLTATAPAAIVARVAALAAGLGAAAGFLLAPWTAFAAVGLLAATLLGLAVAALQDDYWIPVAIPLIGLAAAPAVAYIVRYLMEDRVRRQIQQAFGHYLSPAIVDRLADDPAALRLGGERREITVMFADLSGFTALSGRLEPEALTAAVNRYLGFVVDEVEKTGGYVDKFIGDAVMAMWGAPVADRDHALNAVRAAVIAADRIRRVRANDEERGIDGFSVKIGINSGPAVVGNVGTEHRYNYTAVGETVNLASRLEGVPGIYCCSVVIGAHTAELVGGEFLLRELDWILVKGAKTPTAIYEPVAIRAEASPEQIARVVRFGEALRCYRATRFGDAAAIWHELASGNGRAAGEGSSGVGAGNPAAVMAARAREFVARPPPAGWDAVNVLSFK
jgi:adenylate cyclase